ncbi:hypothetical protein BLNAU_21174 [Blattamonas nauphoetae]|uniref:Uncharacterized protein n=1 Tax=Blattamonas nauphoetae TaxID=2049346 RepID=A0ABQ9WWQ0_9EUKA|nr:hypothetical protein BLNAU_21174 [Blattamonas nauphoetae]
MWSSLSEQLQISLSCFTTLILTPISFSHQNSASLACGTPLSEQSRLASVVSLIVDWEGSTDAPGPVSVSPLPATTELMTTFDMTDGTRKKELDVMDVLFLQQNQPHNLILLFSQTEIAAIIFPELSSTTDPFEHPLSSPPISVLVDVDTSSLLIGTAQPIVSHPLTEVSIDSLLSQNLNFSLENASVTVLPSTTGQQGSVVVSQTPSSPSTILLSHSSTLQSLFVIPFAAFKLSEDHPHSLHFHLQDASLTRIQVTSYQISLLNMTVPSSFAQFTAKDNPHTLFKATKENAIVLPLSQPYSKSLLAFPILVLHSLHSLFLVNLLKPTQLLLSAQLQQIPSEQLLACFVYIDKLFCVMEWGSDALTLFVLNMTIPSNTDSGDSSGQGELKSKTMDRVSFNSRQRLSRRIPTPRQSSLVMLGSSWQWTVQGESFG